MSSMSAVPTAQSHASQSPTLHSSTQQSAYAQSQSHYARLSQYKQFAALRVVTEAHGWAHEGAANILRELSPGDGGPDAPAQQYAYLIMVGRVMAVKNFVGPMGSFNSRFGNLEKAKYSFVLASPDDDPIFKAAWDAGMANLKTLEAGACGGNSQYFFVMENGQMALRFTLPIFRKKGEAAPEVDTSRWPVGSENKERLVEVAKNFDARPFPLYNERDELVPIHEVERLLPGALVEVHFRLLYYTSQRDGRNVDSMTGESAQVCLLRRGKPKPVTPFVASRVHRPAPSVDARGNLLNNQLPRSGASTQPPAPHQQQPPSHAPRSQLPVPGQVHAQAPQFVHPNGPQGVQFQAPLVAGYQVQLPSYQQPAIPPSAPQLAYNARLQTSHEPAASHVPPPPPHPQPAPPTAPAPENFAAHLQPEQSPHGSHPFVYAQPTPEPLTAASQPVYPLEATQAHAYEEPTNVQNSEPPQQPEFGNDLQPETSPHGAHPFIYAHPGSAAPEFPFVGPNDPTMGPPHTPPRRPSSSARAPTGSRFVFYQPSAPSPSLMSPLVRPPSRAPTPQSRGAPHQTNNDLVGTPQNGSITYSTAPPSQPLTFVDSALQRSAQSTRHTPQPTSLSPEYYQRFPPPQQQGLPQQRLAAHNASTPVDTVSHVDSGSGYQQPPASQQQQQYFPPPQYLQRHPNAAVSAERLNDRHSRHLPPRTPQQQSRIADEHSQRAYDTGNAVIHAGHYDGEQAHANVAHEASRFSPRMLATQTEHAQSDPVDTSSVKGVENAPLFLPGTPSPSSTPSSLSHAFGHPSDLLSAGYTMVNLNDTRMDTPAEQLFDDDSGYSHAQVSAPGEDPSDAVTGDWQCISPTELSTYGGGDQNGRDGLDNGYYSEVDEPSTETPLDQYRRAINAGKRKATFEDDDAVRKVRRLPTSEDSDDEGESTSD